ncbi:MAG TPA: lipoyl(octanoyl) transferase LipB [Solirubrobacteraceae bacterium]|nr:lipoyl(octanoyl) transferase LipB [Solirubrobacteraceae bacterium]
MTSEMWVCNLGLIDYQSALELQERVRAARQQELIPDTLLLLEHPRVYTRGRRSDPGELTMGADFYAAQGIEIIQTNRGGKVTYHGPGQLVGYPIVRVDDVVAYVRTLELALVAALREEGIYARARPEDGPDYTGVWVEDRKIASIGVHVARGVTTHGFAVNVDNDLTPFSWVVACGLPSVTMTSVALESGGAPPASHAAPASGPSAATGCASERVRCFRKRAAFALAQTLGHRQRLVTRERLEGYAAQAESADRAVEVAAARTVEMSRVGSSVS